jgi:two-component system sensor histidine kinase PhoQ
VVRFSIHARLLVVASLVLAGFLGLTGLVLEQAYRASAEKAMKERLESQIYGLLAAAEEDQQGRLSLPRLLSDPRFNRPDSGYYAQVSGAGGGFSWQSASMVGRQLSFLQPTPPGQRRFHQPQNGDLLAISFGVSWEDFEANETDYVLAVAIDLSPHQQQIEAFRNTLFLWLGGVSLLLLLIQGLVLRWGLTPLRTVAVELEAIESGRSEQLQGRYPLELTRLTNNINSLIQHAQARQKRFRDSLGDLAHSLKTPLAVLQGLADRDPPLSPEEHAILEDQVQRMNQIVAHQLQRAAASGRTTLTSGVPLKPTLQRLARSLDKVYREKGVERQIEVSDKLLFHGDEGDLMEILGNLLDNAWKYGRSQVRVGAGQRAGRLEIHVEDDGPGIPADQAQAVLMRGKRLDQQLPGQGIGLSVVQDIVEAYGGTLSLASSTLGGADVSLSLPLATDRSV